MQKTLKDLSLIKVKDLETILDEDLKRLKKDLAYKDIYPQSNILEIRDVAWLQEWLGSDDPLKLKLIYQGSS